MRMRVTITPTIQAELEPSISSMLENKKKGRTDPTDPTYEKIKAAIEAGKPGRPVVIDADGADLAELKSRASYEIETCQENLEWESERGVWLGRLRAWRALLRNVSMS